MEGTGLPGKIVVQRATALVLGGPGPTRVNRAGVVQAHISSLHALWDAAINKRRRRCQISCEVGGVEKVCLEKYP
jgi:hypothetical protein